MPNYNRIEMRLCSMGEMSYYPATDMLGRKWAVAHFSTSGIWRMECLDTKRPMIYVNSLTDADHILGGGAISGEENENSFSRRRSDPDKNQPGTTAKRYDTILDMRSAQIKKAAEQELFSKRLAKREAQKEMARNEVPFPALKG